MAHPVENNSLTIPPEAEKTDRPAVPADHPANALHPASAPDPNGINTGGVGDLLVAPTRIVLDGHTRTAEILLNNKGIKTATYRISFTHVRMDDNGRYVELDDKAAANPSLKFADGILRYSPHQVVLKPGETQVVKVMVRPSEGLADGEYCSHLLFRAVPDASAGNDVEALKPQAGRISIRLIPIYGVSIPIIVRRGALSAQVRLRNVRPSGHNLSLTIMRSGSESVYGDLFVTEASSGKVIGQIRGIAVLATNDRRNVSIPLTVPAKGKVIVEYRERMGDGGKILDKASLVL